MINRNALNIPPLRAWTGQLTEELVRAPGKFGLGQVPAKLTPDATTTSVCGYCSTGCGLTVHMRDSSAINLSADPEYPVNMGMACPKGWEALAPLDAPDRGTTPLLRTERGGELEPCDWERALILFCERLKETKAKYGPESVAFLSTGQFTTEEMAYLGCLFKFGMGFVHCDSNTRQCMATAHVAYKESFGFDAPPFTYADFEESDVLVFIGSNLCLAHPILWQRVMRNRNKPEIIVVDPRVTETAASATQHYAIRPKSDLTLLYGLAHLLIRKNAVKREFVDAHTSGFDAFEKFVEEYTPEFVAEITGITPECLETFANSIVRGKAVSFWWTMGVNQGHESTRTAQAIINLALMTGNIGRPGTGANSITGQCNAMGSRVFGNITSLLGGHNLLDPAHRAKISSILGLEDSVIPQKPALAYDQIVDRVESGEIKALWVIATNSAHSWVQQGKLDSILDKLDFLVVQDMYPTTETAKRADLYFPAAGWGEKEGTMINSERRIGLTKKVRRAPGEALSDFHIFQLVAHYWGCGGMFREWSSPEAVFQILKRVSAGQPCDFSGIADYHMLDECGGVQWPFPASAESARPVQQRRLFADGLFFTDDKRARFKFEAPQEAPEKPDPEYPFVLLTGRGTSSQWHTNTRTGKSDILRKLYPKECYVELHPMDATVLRVKPNESITLESRRGKVTARAFITPTVQAGQLFMPMHYTETNQLTAPVFDAYSRQPSYKACAVRIRKSG